jgi:hypothetical protein
MIEEILKQCYRENNSKNTYCTDMIELYSMAKNNYYWNSNRELILKDYDENVEKYIYNNNVMKQIIERHPKIKNKYFMNNLDLLEDKETGKIIC